MLFGIAVICLLLAGVVGLLIGWKGGADCSWCKQVSCYDTDWWKCETAKILPEDCAFKIQGNLTASIECPSVCTVFHLDGTCGKLGSAIDQASSLFWDLEKLSIPIDLMEQQSWPSFSFPTSPFSFVFVPCDRAMALLLISTCSSDQQEIVYTTFQNFVRDLVYLFL